MRTKSKASLSENLMDGIMLCFLKGISQWSFRFRRISCGLKLFNCAVLMILNASSRGIIS